MKCAQNAAAPWNVYAIRFKYHSITTIWAIIFKPYIICVHEWERWNIWCVCVCATVPPKYWTRCSIAFTVCLTRSATRSMHARTHESTAHAIPLWLDLTLSPSRPSRSAVSRCGRERDSQSVVIKWNIWTANFNIGLILLTHFFYVRHVCTYIYMDGNKQLLPQREKQIWWLMMLSESEWELTKKMHEW